MRDVDVEQREIRDARCVVWEVSFATLSSSQTAPLTSPMITPLRGKVHERLHQVSRPPESCEPLTNEGVFPCPRRASRARLAFAVSSRTLSCAEIRVITQSERRSPCVLAVFAFAAPALRVDQPSQSCAPRTCGEARERRRASPLSWSELDSPGAGRGVAVIVHWFELSLA